jgi:hypothetical protein
MVYSQNEITEHINFVVAEHRTRHSSCSFLKENYITFLLFLYGAVFKCENRKDFIKLCYDNNYCGVGAEVHFFATFYGKVACDGIGGTVAKLAMGYCKDSISHLWVLYC